MRKAGFYFCGAILSVSALVLGAGCGPDSSSGATGGSGGGTNPASSSSGGESTSSNNPTSSPASSGSGGPAATCDSYCSDIATNCTGDLAQYPSPDACKSACKGFPSGEQKGATLECHAYHAGMPAVMDAKTHCPHAGPTGGDKIVSDMMDGTCGDGCTNFCNIALKACAGQTGAYADLTACTTDCRKFKDTTQDPYNSKYYTDMANWKNDFGCRMYHLSVAATNAELAKAHCPHIVSGSPVCTK